MKAHNDGFMERTDPESDDYAEKLEAILDYAEDADDFDDSFVLSLKERLENGGMLSAKQKGAIDNIIHKFKLGE